MTLEVRSPSPIYFCVETDLQGNTFLYDRSAEEPVLFGASSYYKAQYVANSMNRMQDISVN